MIDFGQYIRIRFGLAPGEPTAEQLEEIMSRVKAFVQASGCEPTIDELYELVVVVCPSTGKWKYGADVNVELRRQLAAIRAQTKR